MAINGKTLIRYLELIAPPSLALEKDRIGFQLGSLNHQVTGIVVALEITEAVVNEAISIGANWIFTHHALIFQPLGSIRTDQPRGRILEKLIQHQIQVYVAHTNLDTVANGVNDVLSKEIGLLKPKTFLVHGEDQLLKLVVFVPTSHLDVVRTAIGKSGAGAIGDYSYCSFATKGTGTFFPGEGTNPYIGSKGQLTEVEEYRLETVLPKSLQSHVVQAVLSAHPYEEVAYELYPLEQNIPYGMGKIGFLPSEVSLRDFVSHVKTVFELKHVQVVGELESKVKKVAILGGAGSRYVSEAKQQGADVYITGDIDYHTAQAALEEGICLIDVGHATEQRVIPSVCEQLEMHLPKEVQVYPSQVNFNPFQTC
jgi:dinuclear metal center YbgI/SA1388 family protein